MKRIRLMDVEPPRLITERETAHLLGLSTSELSRLAPDLETRGMPRRHPVLQRRDARALHQWLDREFGLQSPAEARRQTVLERLAGLGGSGDDGTRAH